MRRDRIDVKTGVGNYWSWVGGNGKKVADGGEGYKTKAGLKKALLRLKDSAADIPRMVDKAIAELDKK